MVDAINEAADCAQEGGSCHAEAEAWCEDWCDSCPEEEQALCNSTCMLAHTADTINKQWDTLQQCYSDCLECKTAWNRDDIDCPGDDFGPPPPPEPVPEIPACAFWNVT